MKGRTNEERKEKWRGTEKKMEFQT